MSFEKFINSLAFVFLTEPEMQPTVELAGVNWFKLPDFDSVKVVREYLTIRADRPHASAVHAIRDGLRFIEACGPDLKLIPTDHVALSHEFKRHSRAYAFEKLGRQLIANPESGDTILQAFSPEIAEGVKSASAEALIPYMFEEHMARVKSGEAIIEIPGFELLSAAIGGFNPGRVIMAMGSTGFGKTNLGLNLALRAAAKYVVGYVNMEMVFEDMVKRMVVIGTSTPFDDYDKGNCPRERVEQFAKSLGERFHLTSGRPLTVPMIEAWARSLNGLKFLIVDYDQKLDLPLDRHTPEWKAIQKAIIDLESIAQRLGICILVFAQVNRDGEISSSHRANFTAHTVMSFEDHDEYGPVIILKKNRHGKKGAAIRVRYDEATAGIYEIEQITISSKKPKPTRIELKKSTNQDFQKAIERYL